MRLAVTSTRGGPQLVAPAGNMPVDLAGRMTLGWSVSLSVSVSGCYHLSRPLLRALITPVDNEIEFLRAPLSPVSGHIIPFLRGPLRIDRELGADTVGARSQLSH